MTLKLFLITTFLMPYCIVSMELTHYKPKKQEHFLRNQQHAVTCITNLDIVTLKEVLHDTPNLPIIPLRSSLEKIDLRFIATNYNKTFNELLAVGTIFAGLLYFGLYSSELTISTIGFLGLIVTYHSFPSKKNYQKDAVNRKTLIAQVLNRYQKNQQREK